MRPNLYFLLLILTLGALQGCNTLYNYSMIDIEVVEPGKLILPEKYSTAAIRYNNIMDSYYLNNSTYYINSEAHVDTTKLDSLAAKIYFNSAIENLNKQIYFDSIIELSENGNSQYYIIDSLVHLPEADTSKLEEYVLYPSVLLLSQIARQNLTGGKEKQTAKILDPKLGLYTTEDLKEIADSTDADLLISLDYFSSIDVELVQKLPTNHYYGNTSVYGVGLWNFYNLRTFKSAFFYDQLDTLTWDSQEEIKAYVEKNLPPRRDAVLNAADVMGIRLAEKLIPHWITVQRLYYISGHVELQKTKQLVEEGKWLEAAEIWKANVNNPNKKIAAKSMYNLGVACEMQGDLEAAIDWIVRSFQVFGNKNEFHYLNCIDYINILGQRKLNFKLINQQLDHTL
ncbi:hypothetical protein GM418_24385 [Maribellus comscasis]|uniref:Tetratricopeptide repeat protein n=1 Tax=Maribellus comscasis TaxID=2681766 RepID=A0A6I6K2L8_9BACT|nr:DUF6340 family protein [Maribellus comscasis]QGY46682.1 hypothetical protein GM418_24385 [Maribellus comscasis]